MTNFRKKVLSEIFESKFFWFGLVLKIILAGFFASKFLTDLFLPFVNFYTNSGFSNPYNEFFLKGEEDTFPYPALMLWLISLPYYFSNFFINNSENIAIFSLRISVVIADFSILLIFARWLKNRTHKLLIFYWLSPVLIYINYIHGQLDCIPIMILLTSLYFLFKEKFLVAAIILGAAIACKTNIILAVPFFLIYLYAKKVSLVKIASCAVIFVVTFLLINLPYINSEGFLHMVLLNSKQNQIFNVFYNFIPDKVFYVIPAIYLALLLQALMIKGYNRDVFIMFLGFTFGVLNLFIPPMQGWYYWVLPFLAYFYIKQKNAPNFLFFALQAVYFFYFLTIKDSDYFQVFQLISPEIASQNNLYHIFLDKGLNAEKLVDLSFTILQVLLLLNCFWIYRKGVDSFSKHKLVSRPYLLGISGDSGVGKSTLVASIVDIFGKNNVTTICGDDMHKWERGHEKWREFTHLNPSANKLYNEIAFLRALKNGEKISRSMYNHDDGKFTKPKNIMAKKIIVFEGLHSFYVETVRNLFDVKIFVKPEKNLRLHWKIIRDQIKRGYSKERVLEQIKQREEDSEKFILSQEKYADVKIELFSKNPIKNLGDAEEKIELSLKISCSNSVNLEALIEAISKIDSLRVEHKFDSDKEQFIKIEGNAEEAAIEDCGDTLLGFNFEEINLSEPKWVENFSGLIQIFLAFYIIQTELNDEGRTI